MRAPRRAAALAACLLVLATGAAAWTCTPSSFRMDLVAPFASTDPIAKCLTSMRVNVAVNCNISLTPRNSAGSYVDGIWSSDDALIYERLLECPIITSDPITPTTGGTKLSAVRNALIRSLRGFVYGFTPSDVYNKDVPVNDLDIFPGRVVMRRTGSFSLYYAITETDVASADIANDDDFTPLSVVNNATQLFNSNPIYDASSLVYYPSSVTFPCPANTYGVMIGAANPPTAYKLCAPCPAGTTGIGYGCSTCPAGTWSFIGLGCQDCPPGTYSPAGSSDCMPCPTGTYSDEYNTQECKECPEDSYAWIPGSTSCLRCIKGVPQQCVGDTCPTNSSSPATHIVSARQMATCGLDAATGTYELKTFVKCLSWRTATPTLQMAFTVAGDCSIQISPITDPSCADPTSEVGYPYGSIQLRGYYKSLTEIRTLLDPSVGVTRSLMFSVDPSTGTQLTMKFFAATTDPLESESTVFIKDAPSSDPRTCTAILTVVGGQLVGLPGTPDVACPAGSYFDGNMYCPMCPTGYTCSNNRIFPCAPNEFNPLLGLGGACTTCNATGNWTSYEGAASCTVPKVDLRCMLANTGGVGMSYDMAAQTCQPCAPGTVRNDTSFTCTACPPGTYSGAGAVECVPCPTGQYNPLDGLANQTSVSGIECIYCPRGSIALSGLQDPTSVIDDDMSPGATFCSPCPAGTYQNVSDPTRACVQCSSFTYRSGDATPENNVCRNIPPGYLLKDATHTEIDLCPTGQVSFWSADGATRYPSASLGDEERCLACSGLDAAVGLAAPNLRFAHTFAPRRGMSQCTPCPGGTIPRNVAGATPSCMACPHGTYRDSLAVSALCLPCGPGREVGASSRMDCTNCRPGYFMNADRAFLNTTDANSCAPCPMHEYRPTFGATSCLKCPRGTQTQNIGNVECTECPLGYFSNTEGVFCTPAPAGTFVNRTGTFVPVPCGAGTWNNEVGQDSCMPCGPGKFANTLGSKECKTCAAGTFSKGQASACANCKPGFASVAGAGGCSPCKPGTFTPDGKSAACKLCPRGFQCPTSAMRREGPCPRGTFSNKEGNRLCTPCPANTFSSGGGRAANPQPVRACVKCAAGFSTRGKTGQSGCQANRPQVRL